VDLSAEGVEKPREGLKATKTKKQKVEAQIKKQEADDKPVDDAEAARRADIARKRKEKRQAKNDKKTRERAKKEQRKASLKGNKVDGESEASTAPEQKANKKTTSQKKEPNKKQQKQKKAIKPATVEQVNGEVEEESSGDDGEEATPADLAKLDFSGLVADDDIEGVDEDEEEEDDEVDDDDEDEADEDESEDETNHNGNDMQPIIIDGLDVDSAGSASEDESDHSPDQSPTFDEDNTADRSSASSTSSSIPPPAKDAASTDESAKPNKLPQIDQALLRERLEARISALRAARKADGLGGKPARNRQELIEGRRRKEEARKAAKKELRAKSRITQDAEAEAARLRGGSGSPLWSPAILSPRQEEANSFSFGKIAFDDGSRMDSTLSAVVDPKAKKGTSDIKTALEAALKKKERLAAMDKEKRSDIEEKDRWLNAKKRVHGERIKDDTNLLKKTLKRKEKTKGKSEKEWDDRIEGVKAGQATRQKKREENLKKRADGKGQKGGKPKGGSKSSSKGKKPAQKKRPGFEGTFKSGGRKP
jgi:hypothetical protein